MYYDKAKTEALGTFAAADTATVVFVPGQPFDAKRIVFIYTTGMTTAGSVVTYGVRNVDDSESVTLGSFTLPVAAAGSVFYANLGATGSIESPAVDGSYVINGGQSIVQIDVGQELFITSDGAGTAGVANVYVEGYPEGFTGARIATAVEVTVTPA